MNSVKIDELECRVSGQVLWLRNLNKSRAAKCHEGNNYDFYSHVRDNQQLWPGLTHITHSTRCHHIRRGFPSLKAPKLRIRTIPLYRIYIIQNVVLTSRNSPLDNQFPSLYSILFGLSSVDREWQVYYIQSCYRSLRLTHSSESQEIVEGEAGVAR